LTPFRTVHRYLGQPRTFRLDWPESGDAYTKAYQINIETRNGIVQLNGLVDSSTARMEAERITS
jgi:hypothetical protein